MDIHYLRDHRDAIPTLARWHHAQWAWCTPHLTVEDRIRGFEERARCGRIPTGLVALVDGSVVGLACLVAHDLDSRPDLSPWLASVFVVEAFRGRGIGSALSERTAEETVRLGHDRLFLLTFDKVSFYVRLGWSVLDTAVYADTPATIMVRETCSQVTGPLPSKRARAQRRADQQHARHEGRPRW